MKFKKDKFLIIKKALNKDTCETAFNYLLLKRKVTEYFFKTKFISPYEKIHGDWNDTQVPNTYSIYGDILMETLLEKIKPIMEKETKLKLIPTYSYARIYKNGDVLHRHKDRFSCEISTTLNLGGDPWPIYLSPKENVGIPNGKNITWESEAKGIKVNLKPGDMLLYKGMELEHWREAFTGKDCAQVFFHYNDSSSEKSILNIYDTRPFLGLPTHYKQGE
jgi:hypothetical protein